MRRLTTAPNIAIATLWADMLTSGGIAATVQRYFAGSIAGEIPPDQALPEIWIQDRQTREPIDFRVGRRNKRTLKGVITTLLLAVSKEIRTDRLNLYVGLIPKTIHSVNQRGINYIERKNLTLRTQLKRLNRKTICFSKSIAVLVAVLKI